MAGISGRCYCGKIEISAPAEPQVVTYCHCKDCKRASGAPIAAFAGFAVKDVSFEPPLSTYASVAKDVKRWFCPDCGSPVAAIYDYLPGQIYVGLGLLDQADRLEPQGHAHADSILPWLHLKDSLPRSKDSARDRLSR